MFSCFYHWLKCWSQDERWFMHVACDWRCSPLLCVDSMGCEAPTYIHIYTYIYIYKWNLYDNCDEWGRGCKSLLRPHLNDSHWRYTDRFWHWQADAWIQNRLLMKRKISTHTDAHNQMLKVSPLPFFFSLISSPILLPPSLSPGYLWLIDLSSLLLNKWKLQLVPWRRCFHQDSVWSEPPPPSCTGAELDELVLGNVTFTSSYHM